MSSIQERLRGQYAVGPHLPNGEPEFGWRQFESPPIQHEAANVIDGLVEALESSIQSHMSLLSCSYCGRWNAEAKEQIILEKNALAAVKGEDTP